MNESKNGNKSPEWINIIKISVKIYTKYKSTIKSEQEIRIKWK